MVLNIQYLRAVAALLVVLQHGLNPASWLFNPLSDFNSGARGVDIFFVISGFVMFTAARTESPLTFGWRRIVRIVPLYWIFTLLYVVATHSSWGLADYVQSMLFIPYLNEHWKNTWPILVPGWTLNYEMFFYVIFGVGLLVRRPAVATTVIIVALAIFGLATKPTGAILTTYTSPLLLEFIAGLWLGYAYTRWTFPKLAGLLLPLAMVGLLFWSPTVERDALAGIFAILVVVGALSLERSKGRPAWPWLKLLGDASYAIYLVHPIVLVVTRKAFKLIGLDGWFELASFLAATFALSIAAGVVMHLWVEKPLGKFFRNIGPKQRSLTEA